MPDRVNRGRGRDGELMSSFEAFIYVYITDTNKHTTTTTTTTTTNHNNNIIPICELASACFGLARLGSLAVRLTAQLPGCPGSFRDSAAHKHQTSYCRESRQTKLKAAPVESDLAHKTIMHSAKLTFYTPCPESNGRTPQSSAVSAVTGDQAKTSRRTQLVMQVSNVMPIFWNSCSFCPLWMSANMCVCIYIYIYIYIYIIHKTCHYVTV